jgi:hypothetical protein
VCSEDPYSIQEYVRTCRPLLHERYPGSRALGFVWYLRTGPLVTFYIRKSRRRACPHTILARYLIRQDNDYLPEEWHGNYDDILEDLWFYLQ